MAMASSSSALKFKMDTIERKVDMSLDDIIKQSKRKLTRRNQSMIKNTNKRSFFGRSQEIQGHPQIRYQRKGQLRGDGNQRIKVQQRNDILQGIVAARSSAIRQGKLAESRSHNGNADFTATKLAAQQALSNNVNTLSNKWLRKTIKGTTYPSEGAIQSSKISRISQSRNLKVDRRRPAVWKAPLSQKMLTQRTRDLSKVSGPLSKPQTLDSRFATLREKRKSQFGTHPRRTGAREF